MPPTQCSTIPKYQSRSEPKGSRGNRFAVIAHRFAIDFVPPRERNRRRSQSYVEDYATQAGQTDEVEMGCKNVKLFLGGT